MVISYSVASVDGRLTLSPDTLLLYGDPRWDEAAGSSAGVYERIFDRFHPDALLEGSGSLVLPGAVPAPLPPAKDDPTLYSDYLPEAIVSVPNRKWMVVVDGKGLIRWMYKEFPGELWAGYYLLVAITPQTPAAYLAYLRREKIPYLVSGSEHVDLPVLMEKLSALGVQTVVCTAGGRQGGAMIRAGLLDQVWVETFPAVIGGTATPTLFTAPDLLPGEKPIRLSLLESTALPDGHILTSYAVIRNP
jgi:riboflavin biosynthesis pyrimidine reductase